MIPANVSPVSVLGLNLTTSGRKTGARSVGLWEMLLSSILPELTSSAELFSFLLEFNV